MRARYGPWLQNSQVVPPRGCSVIWREICARAPLVLGHIRCLLGDGTSIDVTRDSWLSPTPLARWPTFVSTEAADNLRVRDLLSEDGTTWRVQEILRLFGSHLAARILAIPVPTVQCSDVRVWGPSCAPRAPTGSLYDLCREPIESDFTAVWIWKLPVHPRVQLFMWKVAWNRLPTRSLLRRRGMELAESCPVCDAQEESTEHAILTCSRARLIWRLAGISDWEEDTAPGLQSFLRILRQSRPQESSRVACIAYQIWLARNAMTFEAVATPAHRIVQRATFMAREYGEADIATLPDTPGTWDSHAASAATRRAILVSWEPPPPGFVKVNFDGSVRGSVGGAGYIIRDDEGRLLAAAGLPLFDTSVPGAELHAAWAGIAMAARILHAGRIIVEGDSSVVIRWIQGSADCNGGHPLLRDICHFLQAPIVSYAQHVYREANCAADWVASHVAQHSTYWVWTLGDCIPCPLKGFLDADCMGCFRTRLV